ncbi:MAG: OmpH family outer membrane protein [Planctomycetes bacterium]|nr:OmpH family outer membrane protein [Planctomycetota bacterium]MBL7106947.1 OmpH family outer membrane protein [Phycisphaerae bacterium]
MKTKTFFMLSLVLVVAVSTFNYVFAEVESAADEGFAVGVVSIVEVFENSQKNAEHRQQMLEEQRGIIDKLETISKEIEAGQAGLKTLKAESDEYMDRAKKLFEKQANLQAQEEFYKKRFELMEQRWTEKLYMDILKSVEIVAREKGFKMVFEKDKIMFPSMSPNELMLSIKTHKLLYSEGCVDITGEVLARCDSVKE